MKYYRWEHIWQKKGTVDTNDLQLLNGYEGTSFDPKQAWAKICKTMDMHDSDEILEVGCGAGFVAQHIHQKYVGIDPSESLVMKHISILQNPVLDMHMICLLKTIALIMLLSLEYAHTSKIRLTHRPQFKNGSASQEKAFMLEIYATLLSLAEISTYTRAQRRTYCMIRQIFQNLPKVMLCMMINTTFVVLRNSKISVCDLFCNIISI